MASAVCHRACGVRRTSIAAAAAVNPIVVAAFAAAIREPRGACRRASSHATAAAAAARYSIGSSGTNGISAPRQRPRASPTATALPTRIVATIASPVNRLERVAPKRAAARMNGAASTRRLFSRIEAIASREGWSVACGRLAGPSAGQAMAAAAPSAVAAASATQQETRPGDQASAARRGRALDGSRGPTRSENNSVLGSPSGHDPSFRRAGQLGVDDVQGRRQSGVVALPDGLLACDDHPESGCRALPRGDRDDAAGV